ncbi:MULTISPECIES: amidohydrolase family protein [Prauserella salsuginis group]|uniref:2-amino-3-carboxymuconate-6-semialdehyde decarboxylase n=1 Tax=Prauserella salsuginis TaxID=387889 RepID=A0ABW6G1A5_9PSEU|nr:MULTISPECIES: amidohydrolase family protein [Prauserella salsuginis group]MCR3722124.1 aminocarboxymuconate-semialdehyde decarboxylase [Prauserella flava]MCR3736121.1 aminocarboxymuconate-semialdehyde decarboxylase [Prauserella salsuginis]
MTSAQAAPVIDVHTHVVPHGWPDLAAECGGSGWPWLRIDSERDAMIMVGDTQFRPVGAACWDREVRAADMAEDRVDIQVVSPTPVFFNYERPTAQAAAVARIFNDLTLTVTADDPRFVPFCQVPLQDADAACTELDRSLAAGHCGVEIGNHIGDRDLDDEGVVTFLQHCAEVGAPVFVHPWDMSEGPRLDRWMARWLTGMPAETHLSILAMILGGVFDRVPDTLRMCFAHGGGSFPFWLGRADNAWHRRSDLVRGRSEHPPSHYTDRFLVDTVVFEPAALRLLVDTVGEDHVLLGSDYPYPLGERPVGRVVRDSPFLDERVRGKLLSGNALRFLGR